MYFQNNFSKRLKQLRVEKGLNQPQLAAELGKSRTCITNWELGERIPSLDILCELATYFHVSLDYLTGYDYLSGNTDEEAVSLEQAI